MKVSRSIVCVVLMGSLVLVTGCLTTGKGPSDEELIAAMLTEWKTAFHGQDLDGMMVVYSEDYLGSRGEDKEQLREFLVGAMDQGYLENAEINLEDADTTIEGDTATVAPVTLSGELGSIDLLIDLKKEADNAWRIVSGERY